MQLFEEEIEDITCPRMDMNFIFELSTRYLTSERSGARVELVNLMREPPNRFCRRSRKIKI